MKSDFNIFVKISLMFANFDGSYESIANELNDDYIRNINDVVKTVENAHLKDENLNVQLCAILQREMFILAFSDIIAVDEQDITNIRNSLNILNDFPKTNKNNKTGFILNQWIFNEYLPSCANVKNNLVLGINRNELNNKKTFLNCLSKVGSDDTYTDLIYSNIDKILENVDMLDFAYKSLKRSIKIYNDYLEKIEGIFNSSKYTWHQKVDLLEYIMDIQYSDTIGNMYYHQSLLYIFNSFNEAVELVKELNNEYKTFEKLIDYVECNPKYSIKHLNIDNECLSLINQIPEYMECLCSNNKETHKRILELKMNSDKEFRQGLELINPKIQDIPNHIYDEEKIRWIMSESRAEFWKQYKDLVSNK